jgi:hypothetical protein
VETRGNVLFHSAIVRWPSTAPVYGLTKTWVAPACATYARSGAGESVTPVTGIAGTAACACAMTESIETRAGPGMTCHRLGESARSIAPSKTNALPVAATRKMKIVATKATQR